MNIMFVGNARRVFAKSTIEDLAKEFDVPTSAILAVQKYINLPSVSDNNFVTFEEVVIDGKRMGPGNVAL